MLRAECPQCGKDVSVKPSPGGDGTAMLTWRHRSQETGRVCVAEVPYENVRNPHE
jgi:hypothetical protein